VTPRHPCPRLRVADIELEQLRRPLGVSFCRAVQPNLVGAGSFEGMDLGGFFGTLRPCASVAARHTCRPVRAQPRRGARTDRGRRARHRFARLRGLCQPGDAGLELDEGDVMGFRVPGTNRTGWDGVALPDGSRLMPDPLLVGRDAAKVEALARA
jgi:hypothetical protein